MIQLVIEHPMTSQLLVIDKNGKATQMTFWDKFSAFVRYFHVLVKAAQPQTWYLYTDNAKKLSEMFSSWQREGIVKEGLSAGTLKEKED